MNIGPYKLSSIETGKFALDGGAMFGIVPKSIWNKYNPADDLNRIDMNLRALLIQGNGKNIIVDTGIGSKWADKYASIYKIDHSKWSLNKSLEAKGLTPEQITDVILTHLHFDHAGGMTKKDESENPKSELVPVFPDARVWVQKLNWSLAHSPTEKDQASYLSENFGVYSQDTSLKNKLQLIETPTIVPDGSVTYTKPKINFQTIMPGIEVFVSNGHTLGMQIVRVSNEKESLYYCADLIPTSSHVRVNFIMGYDCYPMFIMAEKHLFLDQVLRENGILFYEHCPHMAASRILKNEKGQIVATSPIDL